MLGKRTLVKLDVRGYSDIAKFIENLTDATSVSKLNARIRRVIEESLNQVGQQKGEILDRGAAGDSALVSFKVANDAHRFAKLVHQNSLKWNIEQAGKSEILFRIGCATGELDLDTHDGSLNTIAYRLEAQALTGGTLIDLQTYNELSPEFKKEYDNEEEVRGKRNETYYARHWLNSLDPKKYRRKKIRRSILVKLNNSIDIIQSIYRAGFVKYKLLFGTLLLTFFISLLAYSNTGTKNIRSTPNPDSSPIPSLSVSVSSPKPTTSPSISISSIPSTSPSSSPAKKFQKILEINQCILKSETGMSIGTSLINDRVSVGKKIYTSLFYASHLPGWSRSTALAICQIPPGTNLAKFKFGMSDMETGMFGGGLGSSMIDIYLDGDLKKQEEVKQGNLFDIELPISTQKSVSIKYYCTVHKDCGEVKFFEASFYGETANNISPNSKASLDTEKMKIEKIKEDGTPKLTSLFDAGCIIPMNEGLSEVRSEISIAKRIYISVMKYNSWSSRQSSFTCKIGAKNKFKNLSLIFGMASDQKIANRTDKTPLISISVFTDGKKNSTKTVQEGEISSLEVNIQGIEDIAIETSCLDYDTCRGELDFIKGDLQ